MFIKCWNEIKNIYEEFLDGVISHPILYTKNYKLKGLERPKKIAKLNEGEYVTCDRLLGHMPFKGQLFFSSTHTLADWFLQADDHFENRTFK